MTGHLPAGFLEELLAGRLAEPHRAEAIAHLAGCQTCFDGVIEALARTKDLAWRIRAERRERQRQGNRALATLRDWAVLFAVAGAAYFASRMLAAMLH